MGLVDDAREMAAKQAAEIADRKKVEADEQRRLTTPWSAAWSGELSALLRDKGFPQHGFYFYEGKYRTNARFHVVHGWQHVQPVSYWGSGWSIGLRGSNSEGYEVISKYVLREDSSLWHGDHHFREIPRGRRQTHYPGLLPGSGAPGFFHLPFQPKPNEGTGDGLRERLGVAIANAILTGRATPADLTIVV